MDSNIAIEMKNVSKTVKNIVEDRSKKSSIINRYPKKVIKHTIIDNVSIKIHKGDVLGIVGRNGSGKSTFLSLIAKIMEPDTGTIECEGKISTILELGMGFHPDLSGRANIYLKGELYGFSRNQIDERIDKIIDYSGIGEYIDNPVRTYSSGMIGRLAFSIMINVDSEIMLVDEILSVGDTSFSIKAKEHFKKMASSGKTIIIVSHQIEYLESICNRVIWFEKGKIIKDGPAGEVCAEYTNKMSESSEIIMDLALAGVPDSQYKLAMMFKNGGEYGQDELLFEKWIKEAAIHGHTRAQVEYANYLLDHGEVEEATAYYSTAAKMGDAEAKKKISMLSLSNPFENKELIDIYRKIAILGGVMRYRYGTLLLKSAWTDNDYSEAFNVLLKAAEEGSVEAMNQVAIMYRDGIGVGKDLNKMEEYYEKASNNGHIPSMVALSDIYSRGKLLPKNDEKSYNHLIKAAEMGDLNSMYKIASMLRDGTGTNIDIELSNYWFDKYVKTNYNTHVMWALDYVRTGEICPLDNYMTLLTMITEVPNEYAIGYCVSSNIIAKKDVNKLIKLLEFKANNNNIESIKRLANYYYSGIGVEKDYVTAIEWYKKAASLGDSWSKNRLGEMFRDGKGVQSDPAIAAEWFMKSAKQGNITATNNIVNLCVLDIIDYNYFDKAISILESSAKLGNMDAIKHLANYYYSGIGVEKDYVTAIEWYKKAASLGDSWSKNRLGEMFRDGKGVQSDPAIAAEWFMKSGQHGNIIALGNIIDMYASGLFKDKTLFCKAITLLESYANGTNLDAIKRLGNIYYNGNGVEKDYDKALKWYILASKLGDSWCKKRIDEMIRDGKITDS